MAISPGVRLSVQFDINTYTLFVDEQVKYGDLLEDQGYCNINHLIHTEKKKYKRAYLGTA